MIPVEVTSGKNPIILIAPHGNTDTNTDKLTRKLAENLECHSIINNAWKKSNIVNEAEYLGDCNKKSHITSSDAIFSEFTQNINCAINSSKNQIINSKDEDITPIFILNIHGCKNIPYVSLILGYGYSFKTPKMTIDHIFKKSLLYSFDKYYDKHICIGDSTGNYGAYSDENLNQYLFNTHNDDDVVLQILQIEIPYDCRKSTNIINNTANILTYCINKTLYINKLFNIEPKFLSIDDKLLLINVKQFDKQIKFI